MELNETAYNVFIFLHFVAGIEISQEFAEHLVKRMMMEIHCDKQQKNYAIDEQITLPTDCMKKCFAHVSDKG